MLKNVKGWNGERYLVKEGEITEGNLPGLSQEKLFELLIGTSLLSHATCYSCASILLGERQLQGNAS